MNILWLSHIVPYPPKGGSLQRSYNLIRELALRHRVHLYAFDDRESPPDGPDTDLEALSDICEHVEFIPRPVGSSGVARNARLLSNLIFREPYSAQLLKSATMERALSALVSREAIDVLWLDAIELTPYAQMIPARRKVLNHHNAESLLLARRARRVANPLARAYVQLQATKLARYEKQNLPRFDLNIAVSKEDRDVLSEMARDARIEVIPNGVDTKYFHDLKSSIDSNRLLYVGGLTWFPNLDAVQHLIEDIWPIIRQKLPSASCRIVGRIPAGCDLPDLPPGVEVTGFVDDVRPWLGGAAALIVPLRVGGGTRLKILDAMASCTAVVSTSIGCEGLGLLPEKEILIGDTPEEFAEQVARVCQDADLRTALGRSGRERVEQEYSWAIIGDTLNIILCEGL